MTQGRSAFAVRTLAILTISIFTMEITAAAMLYVLRAVYPTRFAIPYSYFEQRLGSEGDNLLRTRMSDPSFDPNLGWAPTPNSEVTFAGSTGDKWTARYDALGSRRDPLSTRTARTMTIATFGDSFTHGDEVQDDETWEHHLASLMNARVLNFGVSAYGTDQALLRFEDQASRGLTAQVVILGIFEENINRIVNRYRPFYLPVDPLILAFKPRFVLEDDRLVLLKNPLNPARNPQPTVADCLDRATANDYWYRRNAERPQLTFPFGYQLAKLALDIATERRLIEYSPLAPITDHLWSDPDTVQLLTAIVERFVATARSINATPVLLLIPDVGEGQSWRGPAVYAPWARALGQTPGLEAMVVVDTALAIRDARTFRVRPDGGHTSSAGNLVIAHAIADRLVSMSRGAAPEAGLIKSTSAEHAT